MKIQKTLNKVAYENTYYLENETGVLLVDPGSEFHIIERKLEEIGKPVRAILLTHTHYDHIMSLDKVRDAFGHPPVYVSKEEESWLYEPEMNLSGLDRHADLENVILKPAEHVFDLDQEYDIEGFYFKVLPTPGHSIGGVSFLFPKSNLVITGDALFKETIGRTDLPTGSMEQLIKGIKEHLMTLPNHYRVYPGHGNETSIGHEKAFNPFLKEN